MSKFYNERIAYFILKLWTIKKIKNSKFQYSTGHNTLHLNAYIYIYIYPNSLITKLF